MHPLAICILSWVRKFEPHSHMWHYTMGFFNAIKYDKLQAWEVQHIEVIMRHRALGVPV